MTNLEEKALESANKAFGFVEDMAWDMDKEFHNYHQVAFKEGYEMCKKEYEEKLRWVPVEEKLPEDCPELFLRKVITKNVLVKRKWNDNGEIIIELNSRFLPSPKVGFVWNYDYEKSEVIEWRSFL